MGLFSRAPGGNQQIGFFGIKGQLATERCIYTAAIRGVKMNIEYASEATDVDHTSDYQFLSPFECVPSLKHNNFSIAGTRGIIAYIDSSASGKQLSPKKAHLLGKQNYWIEITTKALGPIIQNIEFSSRQKKTTVPLAKDTLAFQLLNKLNQTIIDHPFILGIPSLADPQICAYIKALYIQDLLPTSMHAIPNWYCRVMELIPEKSRPAYDSIFSLRTTAH